MKKDRIFFYVVCVLIGLLICIPTGFENPALTEGLLYEKARVMETDNSDLEQRSIVTTGTQRLVLKILTGEYAGDTTRADNVLLGQKRTDKIFKEGDNVLAVIQLDDTRSQIKSARADDFYRQGVEIVLFVCFALFLILFAKATGFRALLSFVFTAMVFWKLLLPAFLRGWNPIGVALVVVALCSTVIILLVGGWNRKGWVALLGTFSGIGITALLALLFGRFFNIPGTVMDYAEALLYAGFLDLQLSDIFIAVIFISSAGAVMDISMDISASQHELSRRMPNLSSKELMISGFRIGAPVIGSMTTTLLFAYSGTFMFTFMAFMAMGIPFSCIFNTGYIAAEVLHTLVGSFGLVLVAPFTAVIGGLMYGNKNNEHE